MPGNSIERVSRLGRTERERESLLSKSGFSWAARRGQSSFNFQIDPDLNQKKKARRRKTLVSASVFVSMTSWLDGKKGLGRRRLSAASVAKIVSGERTTRSTRRPWKIRFRGNWSFDRNFWIRFKRNVLTFLPFSFFSPSLSLSFLLESKFRETALLLQTYIEIMYS